MYLKCTLISFFALFVKNGSIYVKPIPKWSPTYSTHIVEYTSVVEMLRAVEGDRISPLESHWEPLEQVSCFPGVFSDDCHSSAQLLHQFHCVVVPSLCYYYISIHRAVGCGTVFVKS